MNSLSWLIYAADVVGNLQGLMIATAIVVSIGIPVGMLIGALAADDGSLPEGSWRRPVGYVWIPVVAALLAAVIPSTSTLYMIAASEIGETVVTSPAGREMLTDIESIIKQKLKAELADTTK